MCVIIDALGAVSGGLGQTYFSSWVYGMQHPALGFPPLCETLIIFDSGQGLESQGLHLLVSPSLIPDTEDF